jgi:hypothetical protein
VDEMELWEISAALGVATSEIEEWHEEYARLEREYEQGADNSSPFTPTVKYRSTDLLAQRVAAAKGEGPPPEARVMSTIETSELMRRLNGN